MYSVTRNYIVIFSDMIFLKIEKVIVFYRVRQKYLTILQKQL